MLTALQCVRSLDNGGAKEWRSGDFRFQGLASNLRHHDSGSTGNLVGAQVRVGHWTSTLAGRSGQSRSQFLPALLYLFNIESW